MTTYQVREKYQNCRFVGWIGKRKIDKLFKDFTKKDITDFVKNHSEKDVQKHLELIQEDGKKEQEDTAQQPIR